MSSSREGRGGSPFNDVTKLPSGESGLGKLEIGKRETYPITALNGVDRIELTEGFP